VGEGSVPQYHTAVLSSNANETGAALTAETDDTEFILVCQAQARVRKRSF